MPANPRVLYLRSSSGFYGPEKQIMLLAHGVRDAGFDPRILVLYRRGKTMPAIHPLVKRVQLQGMTADQLNDNARFSSRTIWHIVQELKEGQFQILHAHGYKADILGLMAARLAGVPVIGTVRLHTETSLQLQLYKQLDLLALRLCDHVVTVSESLRQAVINAGLAPGKVTAIWNAIDIEALAVQATSGITTCEDLGLRSNNHVVTAVGRLTPQKGYQYLLESVPHVLQVSPNTHFLIAGDGPLLNELERQARVLGIESSIHFLGYRSDIASLMMLSDLIVMPSVREGLPNVVLEALALGKPVIATTVGGIPEIITHEVSGILVRPRDCEALAESICRLLVAPDFRCKLGEQGQRVVATKFTVAAMVERTVALYNKVLAA